MWVIWPTGGPSFSPVSSTGDMKSIVTAFFASSSTIVKSSSVSRIIWGRDPPLGGLPRRLPQVAFSRAKRERKTRTRNNHNANTYDNTTALMIFWKEKSFVTYFFCLEFASQHHLSGVNFFPPTPHKLVHFWVVDVQVRAGDEICEVSSNKAKTASSVEKRCHLTYFLAAFYLVVASGL